MPTQEQFGMLPAWCDRRADSPPVAVEAGVIARSDPAVHPVRYRGVAILLKLTQGIVSELILDADRGMPLVVSPLSSLTVLFPRNPFCAAWIPARRASQVSPIDAIPIRRDRVGSHLNLRTNP